MAWLRCGTLSIRMVHLALFGLLLLSGCAKFHLHESLVLFEEDPEPETPQRMAAAWTETVLHKAGQPSVRGFGGRLVFYGDEKGPPILVDGQLTVYGFDDENPSPNNPEPEKKFVFPQANIAEHQSESALGPSYSFWLPWDAVGGRQRQISLVARFEDASGSVVMSRSAHVTLPGKTPDTMQATLGKPIGAVEAFPVQRTSHEASASPGSSRAAGNVAELAAPPGMQSTTIPVTPSFANRLLTAAKESEPVGRNPTGSDASVRASYRESAPLPRMEPPSYPIRGTLEEEAASQRSIDSGPQPPPVQSRPEERPIFDRVRRRPHRGEWLRPLPPTPRSTWTNPRTTWHEDDLPR